MPCNHCLIARQQQLNEQRKNSSSSDELMDTSNEGDQNVIDMYFTGKEKPKAADKPTEGPEADTEQIVLEAERSKAQMFDLKGESANVAGTASAIFVDQDYQMVDSHVDDLTKRRIQNFEYIDLSKLLMKHRVGQDNDQRLEFVSKNGYTYLSPVSERDHIQINSYYKWEQAFRVFSNILTSKYPQKSTELLQYNHTIQTAATTYS